MSNGTLVRLRVLLAALTGLLLSPLAVSAIAQASSSSAWDRDPAGYGRRRRSRVSGRAGLVPA
jgi:multisubunit Na+/H+ antiporter MnhG subunit